jgi:hypothetical protein
MVDSGRTLYGGNTGNRLVTLSGTAAGNVTALQAAVDSASTAGAPLVVRGVFSLNGQINVPSNSDIDFSLATVTQTANLSSVLIVNNVINVRIRNLRAIGKTTDYVNSSAVYAAAAIRVMGTSSDVQIIDGTFLGMAGLGVFIGGSTTDIVVRGCRMTGPGSAYITATTFNYSGGIVVDPGATRWAALHNDISGFAQGIVTGDNMVDVRIIGNLIHDIPGQHGLYLETMTGGVVGNNVIHDTGLCGMKVQVGTTTATDATGIAITGNTFRNCGAQGILLDNPVGGTPRFRRVTVADNVITNVTGPGIEARYSIGLHVADNLVSTVTTGGGIRIWNSSQFDATANRVNTCAGAGFDLKDVQDYELRGNRIINPGTANGASTEFGILIDGSTTAEGVIADSRITDTLGNARYGIYVIAGDVTTHTFRNNYASGVTDYGFRATTAAACREWDNNDLAGTLGRSLNAPTSGAGRVAPQTFGTAAPTTGAHIVGEVVWNTAPAASGTIGWVCTTAGTPGTWKTFGAISA